MASASVFQDEFTCSVCLDLLKDPVTVPCGHSFCLNCITGCWDQEDHKGSYSCPQCRETFTPRPVLRKNTMLAEVVEKLQAKLQPETAAGSDDVDCDFCIENKQKAVKSCLTCLLSYCEVHIQPHFVARLRRHKLVNATSQLQERICSQHDRIIEVFCRTDEKLICMLCSMDDHNGHKTVSASAEWIQKQEKLVEMKEHNQDQIQQKEEEVEAVKLGVNDLKESAQEAVDDAERIFTELIRFLEEKHSEVTESIRAQESAEVSRAEGLLEQLEQEIAELKIRQAEMEQLQPVEDHIDFLQSFQSLLTSLAATENLPEVIFEPDFSFSKVMRSVYPSLKEKTREFHQAVHEVTGFMTGDTVKLKHPETIKKTCTFSFRKYKPGQDGCGYDHKYNITVNGVGVITGKKASSTIVDFPEHPDWKGFSSKLDLVFVMNE